MPRDLWFSHWSETANEAAKNLMKMDSSLNDDPDHWCSDYQDVGVNKTCKQGSMCRELTLRYVGKIFGPRHEF